MRPRRKDGSVVPGIAPNCTAINIPISFAGDNFISPINLTHAINEALKAGTADLTRAYSSNIYLELSGRIYPNHTPP
jgi:hypothetical protein